MACIGDITWDDNKFPLDFNDNIQALLTENMEGIRKMFIMGYTPCLVPNKMASIDIPGSILEDIEIRIYNRDKKLIGVIIDSEIGY